MAHPDLPDGLTGQDRQVTYIHGPMPPCALHWQRRAEVVEAAYDAATRYGPWAYLCVTCFVDHDIGLDTGRGQRLLPGPPSAGRCSAAMPGADRTGVGTAAQARTCTAPSSPQR